MASPIAYLLIFGCVQIRYQSTHDVEELHRKAKSTVKGQKMVLIIRADENGRGEVLIRFTGSHS